MIFNMTEEEWDGVIQVHLKGTFACTRAAVPLMREQKAGGSSILPPPPAWSGMWARPTTPQPRWESRVHQGCCPGHGQIQRDRQLHFSLCLDKADWNHSYRDRGPEEAGGKIEKDEPADIAPLVAYLASDEAQYVSGQVFGVRGKEVFIFSQPRPVRSIHHSEGWTPDRLSEMFKGSGHASGSLETSGQVFSYNPLVSSFPPLFL